MKMVASVESALAGEGARAGGASATLPAAPDPEVHAMAKRRRFSAAYKLAVLGEADRLTEPGAVGTLLRREGLYSSQLTNWRRERETGALAALGRRRGRKARLTPDERRIERLQARCARLERELEQARTIVDVQKKLCTLLGLPTAEETPDPTGSGS